MKLHTTLSYLKFPDCGSDEDSLVVVGEEGLIRYPEFASGPYPPNATCLWTIVPPPYKVCSEKQLAVHLFHEYIWYLVYLSSRSRGHSS